METRDLLEMEEMLDADPLCEADHANLPGSPTCAIVATYIYHDIDETALICRPLAEIFLEVLRRRNGYCEHERNDCLTVILL